MVVQPNKPTWIIERDPNMAGFEISLGAKKVFCLSLSKQNLNLMSFKPAMLVVEKCSKKTILWNGGTDGQWYDLSLMSNVAARDFYCSNFAGKQRRKADDRFNQFSLSEIRLWNDRLAQPRCYQPLSIFKDFHHQDFVLRSQWTLRSETEETEVGDEDTRAV